jgi:spore germination protein GerM
VNKRGRPTLAAQTKDEALHALYTGKAPKRPRNQVERDVQRKTKGRNSQPNSKTQQAAQTALWLVKAENINASQAALKAAEVFKVNKDNVRRYLRELLKGPTVEIDLKVPAMYSQLAGSSPVQVSLVADLVEVNAAFDAAGFSPLPNN